MSHVHNILKPFVDSGIAKLCGHVDHQYYFMYLDDFAYSYGCKVVAYLSAMGLEVYETRSGCAITIDV